MDSTQHVTADLGPDFDRVATQRLERARRIADAVERSASSPGLLAGARAGLAALPQLVARGIDGALAAHRRGSPLPVGKPSEVLATVEKQLPAAGHWEAGIGAESALFLLRRLLGEQGLDLTHARAVAHLQPPPLAVAVAADTLASASNASLDTYDSGPASIAVERWLIHVLTRLAGLGPT